MNWYKKIRIASVTFSVEGSNEIAQPLHSLDVCHELINFIWYKLGVGGKTGLKMNNIEPDTSETSYNDPLGRINIYMTPETSEEEIRYIIDQYNQYKAGDIKLKFLGISESGIGRGPTARIIISENKTTEMEELPEMNVANGNAFAIIQMLANEGLNIDPNEYGGVINIDELETIINKLEQEEYLVQPYVQEPTEEIGEQGATIYDQGRSYEQLSRYIDKLKEMINYIKINNLPNRNINYG